MNSTIEGLEEAPHSSIPVELIVLKHSANTESLLNPLNKLKAVFGLTVPLARPGVCPAVGCED